MNDLIDTTEMYLRTIYDLEEEGVVPLRARIAERLEQSGPTVSQTVSRMERDGLLHVAGDRHLELTDKGRSLAVSVMRKHRLAERLLVDVIGLPWEDVHAEACKWEHVMSEDVERRQAILAGHEIEQPREVPLARCEPRIGEGGGEIGACGGGGGCAHWVLSPRRGPARVSSMPDLSQLIPRTALPHDVLRAALDALERGRRVVLAAG